MLMFKFHVLKLFNPTFYLAVKIASTGDQQEEIKVANLSDSQYTLPVTSCLLAPFYTSI